MPNIKYPHLLIKEPEVTKFKSRPGGGGDKKFPPRSRKSHGEYLHKKLEIAWKESHDELAASFSERHGVYIEFRSAPNFDLVFKSLENMSKGIRLCNVRTDIEIFKNNDTGEDEEKKIIFVTVYVPSEKKRHFFQKIEEYLNKETKKGKPKNHNLIVGIESLRKALAESFWQDAKKLIPSKNSEWCEVWIRGHSEEVIKNFDTLLTKLEITSKSGFIKFPERTVKLINVDYSELEKIIRFSDDIAEFRKAKHTADFWVELSPREQAEWVEDLKKRLVVKSKSNTSICVLDTGINYGHPLISPVLNKNDCHSINSTWGNDDHLGHGTLMAGLAIFGDLQNKLEGTEKVKLNHVLESVKILPPNAQNDPELWGLMTAQGISLAEIQEPLKNRITCMAVTSEDDRDRGRPTSWSGSLDQITSGVDSDIRRLMIVSAGNYTDPNCVKYYPDFQTTDSVHDPGQGWNVVTVGAYTQLSTITDPQLDGYKALAGVNQLSPFSTTSLIWDDNKWPIKPEVVFEGGNLAVGTDDFTTECSDLSLVSTFYRPHEKLFDSFGMTSAATAQASHFAAQIQTLYPDYWPETVRALMIHSAELPEELKNQFSNDDSKKTELKNVLRACGYGVPNLERALYCASSSLTLISESEIQPFERANGKNKPKDMHLYDLPWPIDILQELGDAEVEMRITLSYFIEPGPGEVGWKDRYRYASHALRFNLNSPTENKDEFVKRINMAARSEDEDKPDTSSSSGYWFYGQQARNKGSIHSDIWKGSAAELANSNLIAISPRIGWWRERNHLGKCNTKTRYALVVSIQTPKLDIYTPVAQMIAPKVPIPIST